MQRVALYAKEISLNYEKDIHRLFHFLEDKGVTIFISDRFKKLLADVFEIHHDYEVFSNPDDVSKLNIDLFISIGGDGTFLDGAKYVFESGIPIIGLNTGRLGFLSRISSHELEEALELMYQKKYSIENRTVIQLDTDENYLGDFDFALNELTIHKNDTSSMITIHAYMNNEFLNSYWADGLIISTPTGSTAYSMSCGGPIVFPGSHNLILTPIAPHNLNVRPIVIPDNAHLTFRVESRSHNLLLSLDSRTEVITQDVVLRVSTHKKQLKLVQLPAHTYLTTLRNKLNWGLDKRN